MEFGPADSLETLNSTELIGLVRRLVGEVERLRKENEKLTAALASANREKQELKDEIRRLKGLPPRPPQPPTKPSGHGEGDRPSSAGDPERAGGAAAPPRPWRFEAERRPQGDADGLGARREPIGYRDGEVRVSGDRVSRADTMRRGE